MNPLVPLSEGTGVGEDVGLGAGETEGFGEGVLVGFDVGLGVGFSLGFGDGVVGTSDGSSLGIVTSLVCTSNALFLKLADVYVLIPVEETVASVVIFEVVFTVSV